uniref:LIM zinc-binding domain-containing protein n=2 Tax=Macrostomum lignano TaxID=282301 RepID=A0A1I8I3Q2_9PLAT
MATVEDLLDLGSEAPVPNISEVSLNAGNRGLDALEKPVAKVNKLDGDDVTMRQSAASTDRQSEEDSASLASAATYTVRTEPQLRPGGTFTLRKSRLRQPTPLQPGMPISSGASQLAKSTPNLLAAEDKPPKARPKQPPASLSPADGALSKAKSRSVTSLPAGHRSRTVPPGRSPISPKNYPVHSCTGAASRRGSESRHPSGGGSGERMIDAPPRIETRGSRQRQRQQQLYGTKPPWATDEDFEADWTTSARPFYPAGDASSAGGSGEPVRMRRLKAARELYKSPQSRSQYSGSVDNLLRQAESEAAVSSSANALTSPSPTRQSPSRQQQHLNRRKAQQQQQQHGRAVPTSETTASQTPRSLTRSEPDLRRSLSDDSLNGEEAAAVKHGDEAGVTCGTSPPVRKANASTATSPVQTEAAQSVTHATQTVPDPQPSSQQQAVSPIGGGYSTSLQFSPPAAKRQTFNRTKMAPGLRPADDKKYQPAPRQSRQHKAGREPSQSNTTTSGYRSGGSSPQRPPQLAPQKISTKRQRSMDEDSLTEDASADTEFIRPERAGQQVSFVHERNSAAHFVLTQPVDQVVAASSSGGDAHTDSASRVGPLHPPAIAHFGRRLRTQNSAGSLDDDEAAVAENLAPSSHDGTSQDGTSLEDEAAGAAATEYGRQPQAQPRPPLKIEHPYKKVVLVRKPQRHSSGPGSDKSFSNSSDVMVLPDKVRKDRSVTDINLDEIFGTSPAPRPSEKLPEDHEVNQRIQYWLKKNIYFQTSEPEAAQHQQPVMEVLVQQEEDAPASEDPAAGPVVSSVEYPIRKFQPLRFGYISPGVSPAVPAETASDEDADANEELDAEPSFEVLRHTLIYPEPDRQARDAAEQQQQQPESFWYAENSSPRNLSYTYNAAPSDSNPIRTGKVRALASRFQEQQQPAKSRAAYHQQLRRTPAPPQQQQPPAQPSSSHDAIVNQLRRYQQQTHHQQQQQPPPSQAGLRGSDSKTFYFGDKSLVSKREEREHWASRYFNRPNIEIIGRLGTDTDASQDGSQSDDAEKLNAPAAAAATPDELQLLTEQALIAAEILSSEDDSDLTALAAAEVAVSAKTCVTIRAAVSPSLDRETAATDSKQPEQRLESEDTQQQVAALGICKCQCIAEIQLSEVQLAALFSFVVWGVNLPALLTCPAACWLPAACLLACRPFVNALPGCRVPSFAARACACLAVLWPPTPPSAPPLARSNRTAAEEESGGEDQPPLESVGDEESAEEAVAIATESANGDEFGSRMSSGNGSVGQGQSSASSSRWQQQRQSASNPFGRGPASSLFRHNSTASCSRGSYIETMGFWSENLVPDTEPDCLCGSLVRGGGADSCKMCHGRVYPMERLTSDGQVYHKSCYRCYKCKRQL